MQVNTVEADYLEARKRLDALGIEFPQHEAEFRGYLTAIREHQQLYLGSRRCVYVEIGTRNGGSLFMTGAFLPPGSLIVSIDLEGEAWGRNGSALNKRRVADELQEQWQHEVHLLEADSQSEETLAHLRQILAGAEVDLLFIDGDHSYRGSLRDWELYHPLVAENGLVGFHDILEEKRKPGIKVFLVWRVLKTLFPCREFCFHPRGAMGLRLLHYRKRV